MLSSTIHHFATVRRSSFNVTHLIYRYSSEVVRQQVQVESTTVVNNTSSGGHDSSREVGLPQLQVILRNGSDNGSRKSRNLRRGVLC